MTEAAPKIGQSEPVRPGPDRDDKAEDEFGVSPELILGVRDSLREGRLAEAGDMIAGLHAADLADLIEQVGPEQRGTLIDLLRPDFDAEIFTYLSQSLRDVVLDQLEPKELAAAVAELESDDAIDLIEDLEADQQREILDNLPPETRALVEEGLTFPEDSAGRLMSRDLVSVPQFWTVGKTWITCGPKPTPCRKISTTSSSSIPCTMSWVPSRSAASCGRNARLNWLTF